MEVLLESEEQMARNKQKGRGKRQRPAGPPAPSPAVVADQTGRLLAEREREWLERLTTDPASFAAARGFAVSAFVFGFRSLSYIPDGSKVRIRVGLQDQRATEARSGFCGP